MEVTRAASLPVKGRAALVPAAKRADIQGLRAIAILAVGLFHAQVPGMGGGYVGVDVFFVISGFLITGLLVREVAWSGRIGFAAFYARRIRRLLPAALLVLAATALAAYLLLSPLEQRELVRPLLTSALYSSNFWFALQATDYLAGDVHANPLLHTWSLAVEEQFYLAWPLLLLLAAACGPAATLRRRLWIAMTLVFAGSLAASLWLTTAAQPWAFFSSPARAWEFAAGGLVFMAGNALDRLSPRSKDGLVIAGLAMVAAAVALFDDATRFPGVAALLPVAGTSCAIAGGTGRDGIGARCFGGAAWQWIGNLSYSWYLWHWPVLVFPALLWGPLSLVERLAWLGVSLLLAAATYRLLEDPVRSSPLLAVRPATGLALGMVLTGSAVACAVTLRSAANTALASAPQSDYKAAREALPAIYADGCHLPFEGVAAPPCVYGAQGARRTMVLFGDSHAAQWFPALERVAREGGWRLVSLTKSACPSADVRVMNAALGRTYSECMAWRSHALRRIEQDAPALVVLGNAESYVRDPRQKITADEWQAGIGSTVARLRRAGAAVMLLRDTPRPGFDVPVCLSRAAWRKSGALCDFPRPWLADEDAGPRAVPTIDLSDALCSRTRCLPVVGGTVAYRDNHHLTTTVSRQLAPAVAARLTGQVRQAAKEGDAAKQWMNAGPATRAAVHRTKGPRGRHGGGRRCRKSA